MKRSVGAVAPATEMSAQVSVFLDKYKVSMPSPSNEPLSTWAVVILAVPFASKYTVRLLQFMVGPNPSITVTVAVQLEMLPLLSITIKSTEFAPSSAEVK